MNLALDRFADNPIIDELLSWASGPHKVISLRACFPMIRGPFIEIETANREISHQHFSKHDFAQFWSEAVVIIEAITDITLVSEFDFQPVANRDILVKKVLDSRQECIEECREMFNSGLFQIFLDQYGSNYKGLPEDVLGNVLEAKRQINIQ